MAALASLTGTGMRDQGVVKFYDGARNYGICVGNSGNSAGKDVFIMGSVLELGFMPQASDVLAFTLVVKVRSSGTEKLEAANISLVSTSKRIASGSIGDTSSKNSKRNNISRGSNTSNRSVQDMTKKTAKLTVTPKGQANNNNAQQKKKTGKSIDANNRDQHAKQQQQKHKRNTKKKPKQKTPKNHKKDGQPKQNKAKQNKNKNTNSGSNININTNNSDKFAESALFSSPDPECLPMPDIGKLQRQRTPDAKTRLENREKFAESALFGSPDPACLPMPQFES